MSSSLELATANLLCVKLEMLQIKIVWQNRDHPEALPVAARLRVGEILLEMKRNILAAIKQDSGEHLIKNPNFDQNQTSRFDLAGKKFFYFSAHDTTIAPILGAFQSYQLK